ncbi:MAG: SiaB family protein kinase [Bacteroidales bacterium]|nr:SiaB family protein kinase [Bacteroidales bacterium]MCF8454501.1 SiaB family protein kinase [Bacteroidales bacterium]
MITKVKEVFKELYQGDILYEYQGNITSDSIESVLAFIEDKLLQLEVKPSLQKKAFSVIIESIQNLYHHVDENPPNIHKDADKFGVFVISKLDDTIQISSGNFIKKEKIHILKARIDQVNSLSPEELKYLYREILNNSEFSDKGGGGLGLIDIARKTGNELKYSFNDFNDKFGFLTMVIKISLKD